MLNGYPECPSAPVGAQQAGRRLWRAVLAAYELDEHELVLLRQAVRVADTCEVLQAAVDADGPMLDGKAHPALVELRQQRILLARLVAALRVPLGEARSALALAHSFDRVLEVLDVARAAETYGRSKRLAAPRPSSWGPGAPGYLRAPWAWHPRGRELRGHMSRFQRAPDDKVAFACSTAPSVSDGGLSVSATHDRGQSCRTVTDNGLWGMRRGGGR